jgi:hypothetical protein
MAQYAKSVGFTEQISAPSNPISGNRKLYLKDDGKFYQRDYLGNEVEIGGSGGGFTPWELQNSSTPLLTWLSSTPTIDYSSYYTCYQGNTCKFNFEIGLTDGNNTTGLEMILDPSIGGTTYFFVGSGTQVIGNDPNYVQNYIVPYQNGINSGIILGNFQTAIIGEYCFLIISGMYSINI